MATVGEANGHVSIVQSSQEDTNRVATVACDGCFVGVTRCAFAMLYTFDSPTHTHSS